MNAAATTATAALPQQYDVAFTTSMAKATAAAVLRGTAHRFLLANDNPTDGESIQEAAAVASKNTSVFSRHPHWTSAEMILWYCLVATLVGPVLICVLYFYYHNHRSHRRALQVMNEEDNHDAANNNTHTNNYGYEYEEDNNNNGEGSDELAVMQRNVKAWSVLEKKKITRIVRRSVRSHRKVRFVVLCCGLLQFDG